MEKKRIGFVSTRLAGTDGVSLETQKWVHIFERQGHECFYMAGELDTPADSSFLVPACHFNHPDILETFQECFGKPSRTPESTLKIEELKAGLKQSLRDFVSRFDLDLLIPENASTIPMNIPLGLAISEFAIETSFPMIIHNHDFFWERKRFLYNGCWDYLNKAFPPNLLSIQHACLNSSQDNQLSLRKGVSATVVPNVMDFANPPVPRDSYVDTLREDLGITPGEKLILQPTRIVKRKGIEHAIELVHRLGIPAVLVVSHEFGDEADDYEARVLGYSEIMKVKTILCADRIAEERGMGDDGKKMYTLADIYHECDMVTYPSSIEGFGNAFLEAVYYGCPIMVNNYSVYNYDIRPKGFQTIEIDDYVSNAAVEHALQILENPEIGRKMAAHNYELANKYFSYEVLEYKLTSMLVSCLGAI